MTVRTTPTRKSAADFVRAVYFAEAREYERVRQGAPRSDPAKSYPRLDGGVSASGRRTSAVWPKLVDYAHANRVAPALLLRAVFHQWHNGSHSASPPDPSKFMTPEAVNATRSYIAGSIGDTKLRFDNQDKLFRRESTLAAADWNLTPEQASVQVLGDRHQMFSALYRYIRASELGLAALVERFREEAADQYLAGYQIFNAAIPERIPQSLQDVLRGYLEAVQTGDTDV